MALTMALVCIVLFMPVIDFSFAGADLRLMTYGVRQVSGEVLVFGGEDGFGALLMPTLSVCLAALLALAALLPFVVIFMYKKRQLQARLLGAEFGLLVGCAGVSGYYIWTYYGIVSEVSGNFFFSFFPLLLVIAMLTNWFAIRGVLRDEIMVRAADRLR